MAVAAHVSDGDLSDLLLLGINLVIALVFGALAARSSVSTHEREALEIRQQALQERVKHSAWQPSFPSRVIFSPATVGAAHGDGHLGEGRELNSSPRRRATAQLPLESGRATSSRDFPAASIPKNASQTAAPIISAAAPT